MKGYVYIVSNPALKEDYGVKIGKTKDIHQRIKDLQTSGVPEHYEIEAVFACESAEKSAKVERALHKVFRDNRVSKDREFFRLDDEAIEAARTMLSANCMDLTEFFEERRDDALPKEAGDGEHGDGNIPRQDVPTRSKGALIPVETKLAIARDLQETDLSQQNIADKYNVSRSTVHNISKSR